MLIAGATDGTGTELATSSNEGGPRSPLAQVRSVALIPAV
jgi:hypothetical protein